MFNLIGFTDDKRFNKMSDKTIELSIVIPCLNEAETLETVIKKAKKSLIENNITGEVIIADNGSIDGSQEISKELGTRVVDVERKGYGSALMGGIDAAKGQYIIMGDADDSYDFSNLMPFILKLREGFDLVMGNRFKGGIKKGAMPFLHRYLGNPVLTFIGNLFFGSKVNDFHCGLRGFRKDAFEKMHLVTTGMEFASEMVIKATLLKLKITEVPTTLSPDGRSRPPHLRTWRDGWRHLRFMLIYSPKWLFYYPGITLITLGILGTLFLYIIGSIDPNQNLMRVHSLLYASIAIIIGYQAVQFSMFAHDFALKNGLLLELGWKRKNMDKGHSLERGILIGGLLFIIGIGVAITITLQWQESGFSSLDPRKGMKFVIPSATMMILGLQVFLGNFFMGLLNIDHK